MIRLPKSIHLPSSLVMPSPSLSFARNVWDAKGGGLFFIKWIVFCSAQMLLSLLPFQKLSGTTWESGVYPNFYWILPPFLMGLAFFGLHWRTLAWGIVTIVAGSVSFWLWPDPSFLSFDHPNKYLIFDLLPVSLTLIPHTCLLAGTRRRAVMWPLISPAIFVTADFLERSGCERFLWNQLTGFRIPFSYFNTINACLPGLISFAVAGLAVVALMPPIGNQSIGMESREG